MSRSLSTYRRFAMKCIPKHDAGRSGLSLSAQQDQPAGAQQAVEAQLVQWTEQVVTGTACGQPIAPCLQQIQAAAPCAS